MFSRLCNCIGQVQLVCLGTESSQRATTFTGSSGRLTEAGDAGGLEPGHPVSGSALTPASIESSCCVKGPVAGCRAAVFALSRRLFLRFLRCPMQPGSNIWAHSAPQGQPALTMQAARTQCWNNAPAQCEAGACGTGARALCSAFMQSAKCMASCCRLKRWKTYPDALTGCRHPARHIASHQTPLQVGLDAVSAGLARLPGGAGTVSCVLWVSPYLLAGLFAHATRERPTAGVRCAAGARQCWQKLRERLAGHHEASSVVCNLLLCVGCSPCVGQSSARAGQG